MRESDWKTFKRLREQALERFSQRILDQCRALAEPGAASAHERYLELHQLVKEQDRELAAMFDTFSRSSANLALMRMRANGLLSEDELAELSDECRASTRPRAS